MVAINHLLLKAALVGRGLWGDFSLKDELRKTLGEASPHSSVVEEAKPTTGPGSDIKSAIGTPLKGLGDDIRDGIKEGLGGIKNPPSNGNGPVFTPPGSNIDGFKCTYPDMPGFVSCGTPEDQSCWLRNPTTGEEYNIHTDYETKTPKGVTRNYNLEVTDSTFNANGVDFTLGKLFNGLYPGPLIEACWGDQVVINVTNSMAHNGTSIHWHGIRQFESMQMDGVNGITQCPIAPQSWFLYSWTVTQYGSSWYHSHYSVQYADGTQAPITLHGPSSFPYDEAIIPITITDWSNNSAFEQVFFDNPVQTDILLGGIGNINRYTDNPNANTAPIPKGFEILFDDLPPNNVTRAKRYLLRLINTSIQAMFIFSIDNHQLTVVEADFVPIVPYNTTSLFIAVGQRYNIVVEAKPISNSSDPSQNPIPADGNFWIRTYNGQVTQNPGACGVDGIGDMWYKTGILRYDSESTSDPTSSGWDVNLDCSDINYNQFEPVVPWKVGPAKNGMINHQFGEEFNAKDGLNDGTPPYATAFFALNRPNMTYTPFQVSWENPTFLNLDNTVDKWPVNWMVVPEDYGASDWVYLVLTGSNSLGPHPIHLHGHDFAIIQQDYKPWDPKNFNPKLDNPPRRDVVLLPYDGYAVIAFKTDNPGNWLIHCHIALHASGGLSLQILERQEAASTLWPPGSPATNDAHRLCADWQSWAYDCKNYWPGNIGTPENPNYPACGEQTVLQNDSGV